MSYEIDSLIWAGLSYLVVALTFMVLFNQTQDDFFGRYTSLFKALASLLWPLSLIVIPTSLFIYYLILKPIKDIFWE